MFLGTSTIKKNTGKLKFSSSHSTPSWPEGQYAITFSGEQKVVSAEKALGLFSPDKGFGNAVLNRFQ